MYNNLQYKGSPNTARLIPQRAARSLLSVWRSEVKGSSFAGQAVGFNVCVLGLEQNTVLQNPGLMCWLSCHRW